MKKQCLRIAGLIGILSVLICVNAGAAEYQPDDTADISAQTASETDFTAVSDSDADAQLSDANIIYPVTGGYLYFDATKGEITKADQTVTNVDIPSVIYGIMVTQLHASAFRNCANLTSVTIPDSITTIGSYAFAGCQTLSSVIIPNTVTSISQNTFSGCESLKQIFLPDTITAIGSSAFSGCTALTDVYYAGTLDDWLKLKISGQNDPLITANIHYESSDQTIRPGEFRIHSITLRSLDGEPLAKIPTGRFLATITVTVLSTVEGSMVFFASYTPEGQFHNMNYAFMEASAGTVVHITLPMDNTDGQIGEIKAFAVSSFSNPTPLGSTVSFVPIEFVE